MTLRFEGRRLRPIRLSPVAGAIGLGLVVVAFVAVLASALTGVVAIGLAGWLAGAGAIAIVGRHAWMRLSRRGKLLFGLPALLVLIWCVLATTGLPGASVVGYAAFFSWIVAVGFGVVGRPALTAQLALAKAAVEPSLLRSEAPADRVRVAFDDEGVRFEADDPASSEHWPTGELATARLEAGARSILHITDRIGDEIAIEVGSEHRTAAEDMVRRIERRSR